jgi:hypothetical protein
MIKNKPFFYVGLVGLLIFGGAYWLKETFPAEAPYMAPRFSTPIVFFEFVQSPIEVYDFFGITDYDFDSENFIAKMDAGNKIDFAFAFIYSAFLFLFFRVLAKESEQKWYKAGMVLAILALIGDVFENVQLLGITANLQSGNFETQLKLLNIFTWVKWASIAIAFALYALWLLKLEGVLKLMGYVAWIPLIFGAMAFMRRGVMTELFTRSVSILFFVAIAYCFMYKSEMKPLSREEKEKELDLYE